MLDFATDLKDILTAASLSNAIGVFAATSGWGIYVGSEPDGLNVPDTAITLYSTGSFFPPSPVLYEEYATAQVRIRGAKTAGGYAAAYQKALQVREALHTYNGIVNGTNYSGILCFTDITSIGRDQNNRPLLTLNLRSVRGAPTSDYR